LTSNLKPHRGNPLELDQPSPTRRKLLKACAWLPASSLLAFVGGCNNDEPATTSTFASSTNATVTNAAVVDEPLNLALPPFKTTDNVPDLTAKIDTATTGSTDVLHLPNQLPKPSIPKTVGIYSLQYNSFTQVSARRQVPEGTQGAVVVKGKDAGSTLIYEQIEQYLKRALDNRLALLYRAMEAAFAKRSPKQFDVSFVTAPEFYWNIPFGDFITEDELQRAADLCLETVTRHVRTLISKFPKEKYGKIVLLPGTIAVLKLYPDITGVDGKPLSGSFYTATNQVVCTHNLSLDDKKFPRPAYMIWPKRTVSWIDYFDEANANRCSDSGIKLMPNPAHPKLDNYLHSCVISKRNNVTILVERVSSAKAQCFDTDAKLLPDKFRNNIVEGLPFGIDICLDYSTANVQKDEIRIAQLDAEDFKLDFLLAAGMQLSIGNYALAPFIEYAIRNEGYSGSTGKTEVWSLDWTNPPGKRLGVLSYKPLPDMDSPDGKKDGFIEVDQTDGFVASEGADATGIPAILDKMNNGIVRMWSLDMDTEDTAVKVAAKSAATKPASEKTIQFVE
jgi:hypothetical protein